MPTIRSYTAAPHQIIVQSMPTDSTSQPNRIGQTHIIAATHIDQIERGSERFSGENHGPIDDAPATPMMPNEAPSMTRLMMNTTVFVPAIAPIIEPMTPQATARDTETFIPILFTKPVVGNAMMKPMM